MIQKNNHQTNGHRSFAFSPRGKVPERVIAAVALMEMGVADYEEIASATGLSAEDVAWIDTAEDKRIRQLATDGTPAGSYYHLNRAIRCPKCRERITLAPCVTCDSRWAEESDDEPSES